MKNYHRVAVIAVVALSVACNAFRPTEPEGQTLIEPLPAWLGTAFDSIERCVGEPSRIRLSDMAFYIVNQSVIDYDMTDTVRIFGRTWIETGHIYLERYAVQYPRVWMHEMAHAMYKVSGHPARIFANCNLLGQGLADTTLTPYIYLLK